MIKKNIKKNKFKINIRYVLSLLLVAIAINFTTALVNLIFYSNTLITYFCNTKDIFSLIINILITFLILLLFSYIIRKNLRFAIYNDILCENSKSFSLKSRIQPHFIFNALNTITYYCRVDASVAKRLVLELSNYLRISLEDYKEIIPLNKEISFIKSYIYIEKFRFEDRLSITYDIEDFDLMIPSFTLKPLVENAIKHGALSRKEGGHVFINIKASEEVVSICIRDNGKGMNKKYIEEILRKDSNNFVSLSNINKRLKYIYGIDLLIESVLNEGTAIYIDIPRVWRRNEKDIDSR